MTSRIRQLTSGGRPAVPNRKNDRGRVGRFWLVSWLVVMVLASTPGVQAQQQETPTPNSTTRTPDTSLPASNSQADAAGEADGTPEAAVPETPDNRETPAATQAAASDAAAQSSSPLAGTSPGSPAVLAQGLAFQTGDQVVWQVRELDVPDIANAVPEASNEAIILQQEGSSIVRNDETGKRALLGPGEAYFKAADDLYTTGAQDGSSSIWIFEVTAQGEVADDAFYESPVFDDYDEGTYDLQLIRYVLQPDEQVSIPAHTGTGLLMATEGEIEVEDERGAQILGLDDNGRGDGQLIAGDGTVLNSGDAPAEFVFAAFGSQVDDASAGQAAAAADAETPVATAGTTPAATTGDAATTDDETTDEVAADAADPPPPAADDGIYQTSINITAQVDLSVTVTVDGVVAFDGPIPAGGSSGALIGSVFEVSTSSGANTLFTNACGDEFYMGYAEGPESYTLTADASSCAP